MLSGLIKVPSSHWNEKYTYALWAALILLFHCALLLFLSFWNKNIQPGLFSLFDLSPFPVFYLPIMTAIQIYKLFHEKADSEVLNCHGTRLSGYFLTASMFLFLMWISVKKLLTDPYSFGNYVPLFFTLGFFVTYISDSISCNFSNSLLSYSVWIFTEDLLCILGFFMLLMILCPATLEQATEQTEKAGFEQPVFIGHGDWMNFNSHFMRIDISTIKSSNINIYNRNLMYIDPETLEPGDDTMGYYFFAAQSGAHTYGIAVSEKSGRLVEARIIKNPIPLTINHSSEER